MRITDIALSTPVVGARSAAAKKADEGTPAPKLHRAQGTPAHPDEVAATALQRAAAFASAGRVVAAANEQASASVKGDLLDLTKVP